MGRFENETVESYYIDNYFCFGLSIAPSIFHRINCAISRCMSRKGHKIVSYLDDFLIIGYSENECSERQICLFPLLTSFGFPIKWEKVSGPKQRITFLGIIIDSFYGRLELPKEKILKILSLIKQYSNRKKVTKRALQVLVGRLSFALKALYDARTFTQIFIGALKSLRMVNDHKRLTKTFKKMNYCGGRVLRRL